MNKTPTTFVTYKGKACRQYPNGSVGAIAELDAVKKQKLIGSYRNNWRQRMVEVYEHPTNPEMVMSIGYGFGEALGYIYVCEESIECYRGRIDNNDWSTYN